MYCRRYFCTRAIRIRTDAESRLSRVSRLTYVYTATRPPRRGAGARMIFIYL